MTIDERVEAFAMLGLTINKILQEHSGSRHGELDLVCQQAYNKNPWFTPDNVCLMLTSISSMLDKNQLSRWVLSYPWLQESRHQATVAVVMAGNVPAVGFHDMLCVLISGHRLLAKLSSKDDVILPFVARLLSNIEPRFSSRISFETGIIKDFDAVIATGTDNSARYFEYYFKNYPHVIRKNRTSVAVLDGGESPDELRGLGNDIFSYFGLGCRNVSKLYIPDNYDLATLIASLEQFNNTGKHFKYMNNYEYNKSIYLLNQEQHLDNGFVIFKEDSRIFSPIAVVYYEKYTDIRFTREIINNNIDSLQCVVSRYDMCNKKSVPFGNTQLPAVDEYSDELDTVQFLKKIR